MPGTPRASPAWGAFGNTWCWKVHDYFLADLGIKPVIQNRSLGRDELERRPGHDARTNFKTSRHGDCR